MTQPGTSQPRGRRIVGALAVLLVALTAVAGPAFADNSSDQRAAEARAAAAAKRADEVAASIEGLSANLAQAVLDLAATQARLPVAQAELAAAQAALDASQREAVLIAQRLKDAQALEVNLAATMAADATRGAAIRTAVGQMARSAYKGETADTGLSVVLDSRSPQDFVDQYTAVATALRTQTRALDDLQQIAAVNRNGQSRLAAVKVKVAALKVEADQKVVEADAARATAAARQAEIQQLIVQQAAKQQVIEAAKAQAEAEQAQIEADRAAIAAQLAAIIAKERAAAGAAGRQTSSNNLAGVLFSNPTSVSPMHVTSEYGMRVNPVSGRYILHAGIDLKSGSPNPCGQPEYAARAGTVLWVDPNLHGFGNRMMIDHGLVQGVALQTAYYHMSGFAVHAGQKVAQGQLIGLSGDTGNATGCHLHFEVWMNGATVNPRAALGL